MKQGLITARRQGHSDLVGKAYQGVQLVDPLNGRLDVSRMDRFAYFNPLLYRVDTRGGLDVGFGCELLRG